MSTACDDVKLLRHLLHLCIVWRMFAVLRVLITCFGLFGPLLWKCGIHSIDAVEAVRDASETTMAKAMLSLLSLLIVASVR